MRKASASFGGILVLCIVVAWGSAADMGRDRTLDCLDTPGAVGDTGATVLRLILGWSVLGYREGTHSGTEPTSGNVIGASDNSDALAGEVRPARAFCLLEAEGLRFDGF